MDNQLPVVTGIGRRVSRKEIQAHLFKQFGNFLHTQGTLDFIRDIGPARVGTLGYVIAGKRGIISGKKFEPKQNRFEYFLANVQE
jgi:hypothetical protein